MARSIFCFLAASIWAVPAQGEPERRPERAQPTVAQASVRAQIRHLVAERPGLQLRRLSITPAAAVIGLQVPSGTRLDDLPAEVENAFEDAVGALVGAGVQARNFQLEVMLPGGRLAPPLRPASVLRTQTPKRHFSVRAPPERFPLGQALGGRTIALSPGHGYIYDDKRGRFSTQRENIQWAGCGDCRGIIEDFGTSELAIDYLIPLLEGAGARVVLVRERDRAPAATVVDDTGPSYVEVAGGFSDGSSAGGHDGDYRVSNAADATAEYTLTAPLDGNYWVSTWFVAGSNRSQNARIFVDDQAFLVDQTSHGGRWAPVTQLFLHANESTKVQLRAPATPEMDKFLIADAMRLGGGSHSSGFSWNEMGAQPFITAQGAAPASVLSRGDVSIRPAYAEWQGADIYVSLHSNASGQPEGTASGSVTYRYNCGTFQDHTRDPPASDCDDPIGSDRLQALVHQGLVSQITSDWDANWNDRGTRVANFGEVRTLDGIPGVLVESAFHDNVRLAAGSDERMSNNQAMHHPQWRRAAAYGVYKGISEYFNPGGPLLAAAPTEVVARRINSSTVELDFAVAPNAQAYRVYVAAGSQRFDEGMQYGLPPIRIENLPAETPVSFRVHSLNAAGEGWPSRLVSAKPSARPAQVLLLDGYDREDGWVQTRDNPKNTLMHHGLALWNVAHAFDSAHESAVTSGRIDLSNYAAVVMSFGRESTRDDVASVALRAQLRTLSDAGGALFASGTEIGWVWGERGDAESQAFLADVFGAQYGADDAMSARIAGAAGTALAAVNAPLSDANTGLIETRWADVFTAVGAGQVEVLYENGTDAAGIRQGKNLVLGVALDMVVGADARAAILEAWLADAVTPADPEEPVVDGGVQPFDGGEFDFGMVLPDAGRPDATPGVDAGPSTDAGTARPDAAELPEPDDFVDDGCTCRSSDMGSSAGWLLFGILFFGCFRRRRT